MGIQFLFLRSQWILTEGSVTFNNSTQNWLKFELTQVVRDWLRTTKISLSKPQLKAHPDPVSIRKSKVKSLCLLCKEEYEEDDAIKNKIARTNLQINAEKWAGLDSYGTVYKDAGNEWKLIQLRNRKRMRMKSSMQTLRQRVQRWCRTKNSIKIKCLFSWPKLVYLVSET